MQQLDPHFLFNALSNISSYYHNGDKEHAQTYRKGLIKIYGSISRPVIYFISDSLTWS
jgi:sensor histidine kinase YesM